MNSVNYLTAGTARQAEIHPEVPSHLFPAKSNEAGAQANVPEPPMELAQSQNRKLLGNSHKFDDFDGDDLQLNDFLTVAQRREKAGKEAIKPGEPQIDDLDWISISSTSSPRRRLETIKASTDIRIADIGVLDDEDTRQIRLPNGNWACNHKCKDKTR
jgi:ATP-dependent DNA helicase HFM1/MER3